MAREPRTYPSRPLVGIGIAVIRGSTVLLIRRARPPAAGQWSLPGGAQKLGETAEAAARRELREETGLTVGPLHLAGHVDSIHADPAGAIEFHYTILDFCAAYARGNAQAGGDAAEIAWAEIGALESYTAWPALRRIVDNSLRIVKQAERGEESDRHP